MLEERLATFDMNLAVVFWLVYRERSVTQAATKLNVGQPAVRNSLARLRILFDDPLFLRHGNGANPTPKAEQLAARIGPAMQAIGAALVSYMV